MNRNSAITEIKGIGEKTAALFQKLNIETVGDILLHYPRTYVQFPVAKQAGEVTEGETAAEIFYEDEFRTLGAKVFVSTADGSKGTKGFVTDAIRENAVEFDYFYACGPMPMLRALCECCEQNGELSFEERMGCGFGACMGCSCKTLAGNKRICKDGPVMKREEIIW